MITEANIELPKIEILAVDDHIENLVALESVLNSPQYELIKLVSGEDALRYLLHHEPALILMDVQMPGMDGFETAKLIKQNERTRDIPIIFVTAMTGAETFTSRGYKGGAVDYLFKPFDIEILRAKVSVFADLYRKTQRLIRAERVLVENERKDRERKLAELELKSLKREQLAQQKYRELIDGINHGFVWSADPSTLALTFVSTSIEKITGWPLDLCIQEPKFWFEHIPGDDYNRVMETIQKVIATGQEASLEHRFLAHDEKTIWLHTGIRLGKTVGDPQLGTELRGLSIDISQAKEAEKVLRQNKEHSDFMAQASLILSEGLDFGSMVEKVGQLVVPKIADWYSIDAPNEKNEITSLAISHSDPEKLSLANQIRAHINISLDSHTGIGKVMRTGKPEILNDFSPKWFSATEISSENFEMLQKLKLKSAMIVPLISHGKILATMTLVSAESGRVYDSSDLSFAVEFAQRVTAALENTQLYQQAKSAIRARDEFLSVASHELKTPLTPLKLQAQGLARILRQGTESNLNKERLLKAVEVSDRQINRLTRLIEDLLDVSRINMGKLDLSPETFNFSEMVLDIVERFKDQIQNENYKISLDLPDAITVTWDRLRIEQVLSNLIINALKYGRSNPITIRANYTSLGRVQLMVEDLGIGIEKKDQMRIFDRFERAVTATHFGGLGLGLYIVSKIIAAHDGRIWVDSTPGVGSKFYFELPVSVQSRAECS